MTKGQAGLEGLRDLAALDRVVHEPSRLMILMHLYAVEKADLVFLLNATELTWGNLSSHMSKLEEEGYVEIEKTFIAKKPRTTARLTDAGRQALDAYWQTLQGAMEKLQE